MLPSQSDAVAPATTSTPMPTQNDPAATNPDNRRDSDTPPPPPLDPRIQIELENLNTATDNINRLEIELEEANATFRILLNESTRRLKLLSKKLGNCIDKSRPYHEAADRARLAQIDCQAAAVKFQRAHEHYTAAKETVALAEQRFMSGSHEWQFDNAWQEMLNHATIKVSAAEQQKTECNAEHQRKAAVFREAEVRCSQLEDALRRNVIKSRPYFDEKQICQDQLQTQKDRIQELQQAVGQAKRSYAQALKALELISEEIHRARAQASTDGNGNSATGQKVADVEDDDDEDAQLPRGPREPGVGAEKGSDDCNSMESGACGGVPDESELPSLNFARELDRCEVVSTAGTVAGSEAGDDPDNDDDNGSVNAAPGAMHGCSSDDAALEELRQQVKVLAVRPVDGGGDGQQTQDVWETELNDTVDRLDRLLMKRENSGKLAASLAPPSTLAASMPGTPMRSAAAVLVAAVTADAAVAVQQQQLLALASDSPVRHPSPVRQLLKAEPLPAANVSMRELPLLSRLSDELTAAGNRLVATSGLAASGAQKRRRSLE